MNRLAIKNYWIISSTLAAVTALFVIYDAPRISITEASSARKPAEIAISDRNSPQDDPMGAMNEFHRSLETLSAHPEQENPELNKLSWQLADHPEAVKSFAQQLIGCLTQKENDKATCYQMIAVLDNLDDLMAEEVTSKVLEHSIVNGVTEEELSKNCQLFAARIRSEEGLTLLQKAGPTCRKMLESAKKRIETAMEN